MNGDQHRPLGHQYALAMLNGGEEGVRKLATTARSFGMEMDLISAAEVKRMWPLLETADLIGASWLPTDGQASPSDITQSLAKGARLHGAQIHEGVRVTGFEMDGKRITTVLTNQGRIACETVINSQAVIAKRCDAADRSCSPAAHANACTSS